MYLSRLRIHDITGVPTIKKVLNGDKHNLLDMYKKLQSWWQTTQHVAS
jgi:hypothetical protein